MLRGPIEKGLAMDIRQQMDNSRQQKLRYFRLQPWHFRGQAEIAKIRAECYEMMKVLSCCVEDLEPKTEDFAHCWRSTTARLYHLVQSFMKASRDERLRSIRASLEMIEEVAIGVPLRLKVLEDPSGVTLFSPSPAGEYVLREAALLVLLVGQEREYNDFQMRAAFELWQEAFLRRLRVLSDSDCEMWVKEIELVGYQIEPDFQLPLDFSRQLEEEFPY